MSLIKGFSYVIFNKFSLKLFITKKNYKIFSKKIKMLLNLNHNKLFESKNLV